MLIANVLKVVIASVCLGKDGHTHRAQTPLSPEGCREKQLVVV